MELSKKDIKTIEYEKRTGFVFFTFILAFGGLFDLLAIISDGQKDFTLFFLINLGILFLASLVLYFINNKYNKDLILGRKIIKIETVQKKEEKKDYEVGSGLGGRGMKPKYRLLFTINNFKYEVQKEIFDKINAGELIEMHYTKYSDILLDIKAIQK